MSVLLSALSEICSIINGAPISSLFDLFQKAFDLFAICCYNFLDHPYAIVFRSFQYSNVDNFVENVNNFVENVDNFVENVDNFRCGYRFTAFCISLNSLYIK